MQGYAREHIFDATKSTFLKARITGNAVFYLLTHILCKFTANMCLSPDRKQNESTYWNLSNAQHTHIHISFLLQEILN